MEVSQVSIDESLGRTMDERREERMQEHLDEAAAEPVTKDRMSEHWPATYRGRIPVKVRMAKDLGPDMWWVLRLGTPRIWVEKDDELPVKCNPHGAMSVVTPYGDLGVKPLECDIIEWREPNL